MSFPKWRKPDGPTWPEIWIAAAVFAAAGKYWGYWGFAAVFAGAIAALAYKKHRRRINGEKLKAKIAEMTKSLP